MGVPRRFDPFTMEQSLLNYVFRRDGMMPWRELHWKWSATWPNEKDVEMEVVTLHEKLWKTGPQPLRDMWNRRKGEMLNFHEKRSGNSNIMMISGGPGCKQKYPHGLYRHWSVNAVSCPAPE